ncbi:MAG: restriction endonuclease [Amphritea sp.]
MAFKMAKGSLFAVLLRSPWWYSVLIGLFILLVSLAVTDAQYMTLSIAGSMPFLAIGGYAGFKQLQQPSQKRVLEVSQQAKNMSAEIISEKIAANYIKSGYQSSAFEGNGADLELVRGHRKLLLCSKRFKAANTGIEPLKRLVAASEATEATEAMGYLYLTLGEVTASAHNYAQENNIEIIQSGRLTMLFDGKAKID